MNNRQLATGNSQVRRRAVTWTIAIACAVAFAASSTAPADLHAMNGLVLSADGDQGRAAPRTRSLRRPR